jgi:Flp pilus assembly pilin Flp
MAVTVRSVGHREIINLEDSPGAPRSYVASAIRDPIGGDRDHPRRTNMLNLVEKYTPETEASSEDEGAVAIEYVLIAAAVAAGIGVVFATGLWTTLKGKLDGAVG